MGSFFINADFDAFYGLTQYESNYARIFLNNTFLSYFSFGSSTVWSWDGLVSYGA